MRPRFFQFVSIFLFLKKQVAQFKIKQNNNQENETKKKIKKHRKNELVFFLCVCLRNIFFSEMEIWKNACFFFINLFVLDGYFVQCHGVARILVLFFLLKKSTNSRVAFISNSLTCELPPRRISVLRRSHICSMNLVYHRIVF